MRFRMIRPWSCLLATLATLAVVGSAFSQEAITPAAVRKAKQATVYLRVVDANGKVGEGSGFLAVEPGVVVTNAHVLGMLSAGSKAPKSVEVVLFSGEDDEIRTTGEVLGVDREADLGVVKIDVKDAPAPLQLGLKDELFETQKAYIFGFPFGAQLGKNITVSESSISSLRRGGGGILENIQVNGGMHPGNSGGPVVNAAGRVIGVSVAGIKATQINFAIPASSVDALLAGAIQDVKAAEPYLADGEVRLPLTCTTLDPFKRIDEIHVEVWAGNPAAKRKFQQAKSDPQPGDGPRKLYTLKADGSSYSLDVVLPKTSDGQVAWVQPIVISSARGKTWTAPRAFEPGLAVERKPVDIFAKFVEHHERTVHLKTSQSLLLTKGRTKIVAAEQAELDLLEVVDPSEQGASVRVAFGTPTLSLEDAGRSEKASPQIVELVQRIPPAFFVDGVNMLRTRNDINLSQQLPPATRQQATDYYTQIVNAYEASNIILPNRTVKPGETWQARLPMLIKLGNRGEVVDLALTCAYEGMRARDGVAEALVRVQGRVYGRGGNTSKSDGEVVGKFAFDPARHFISMASLKVTSVASSLSDDAQAQFTFDIDLTRRSGNPLMLLLPRERSAPIAAPKTAETLVKGKKLIDMNSVLSPTDPQDPHNPTARGQAVSVVFTAGSQYTILMNSKAFDTYLRLVNPQGQVVAMDDDGGGGLNSRIDYSAKTSGMFTIIATHFNGGFGPFSLVVIDRTGADSAPAGNKVQTAKLVPQDKVVDTKAVLRVEGTLGDDNPPDSEFANRGSRMKVVPIDVIKGVRYEILLNSGQFDAYLRLRDAEGRVVASNDDGGNGLNSRINHVASETGRYTIEATSYNGRGGAFVLLVIRNEERSGAPAVVPNPRAPVKLPGVIHDIPAGDFLATGVLKKPAQGQAEKSYLKVNSNKGDYIGQGRTYDHSGDQLVVAHSPRGIEVRVGGPGGWIIHFAAPPNQTLEVGEYRDAKRFPFNREAPGLNFSGNGRGCNRLSGEFAIWELELEGNTIVRLAVDFVQRCEERGPPLMGKLRVNSKFE